MAEKFTLRHPDGGHPVRTDSPTVAVRLRAQGWRDITKKEATAVETAATPEPEKKPSTPTPKS